MAAPLNDDSKTLFRLLADRVWHNYEDLISQIAQMVPPGRALRKYEQSIRLSTRRKFDPDWDPGHDDATRIELGQRRIAYATVSNWIRQNALEIRGYRQQKEVRVIPGYTSKFIPGYETAPEAQDPGLEGEGYTEVPPERSGPPEGDSIGVEEVSEPVVGSVTLEPELDWADGGGRVRNLPLVRDGQAEVEPEGGQPGFHSPLPHKWRPMSPALLVDCADCGLAIADQARHEQWHRENVKVSDEPEMALLNTSQLQEAVRAVVSQELAHFQSGMQSWLLQQFMQLEGTIAAMSGLAGASRRFDPVERLRGQA